MAIITAFQTNAFQGNAFQISTSTSTIVTPVVTPDTALTRLPVPGKHFTKREYDEQFEELRKEAIFARQLLSGLSNLAKAEFVFADAEREVKETESRLENNYNKTNYDKFLKAQERRRCIQIDLDKAREEDDGRN